MLERFTARAERTVAIARAEAGMAGRGRVEPEHLLLGLIGEREGLAGQVLERGGIAADRVRALIEVPGRRHTGPEQESLAELGPLVMAAFDASVEEALREGVDYVGTEHLLLSLLRPSGGAVTEILRALGTDPDAMRLEIARAIAEGRTKLHTSPRIRDRAFDFTPSEAFSLASTIAPISATITFAISRARDHETTFQITCQLTDAARAPTVLDTLADVGVRAIVDRYGTVTLRHVDESAERESS